MVSPLAVNQQKIGEFARQRIAQQPVYLDTETTGLDKNAEIIEIAIIDHQGNVVFESYIRPSLPIPADATQIHGITNEMVQKAPTWPALWPTIRTHLVGRILGIYNAEFDLRMMQQSMTRYKLPWRETFNSLDIMQVYSEYRGEWDPRWRSLRRFRLEEAGTYFKIPIPNSHRAADDAKLARAVFHRIGGMDY